MDARKLVRKAERDPWNRLNSILEDADWVAHFCKSRASGLPVIANLRCGAWYVPLPGDGSCYFKSTDGHTLQWHFSLKRYNLQLIKTIQEQGGCVIVDSTRRGKSMPDALSKTVPIWCAVLNAASLKRNGKPIATPLTLPEHVVSPSEREQIASKVAQWTDLLLSSELPVPSLQKPLRPLFVSRSHHQDEDIPHLGSRVELDYYPVVLVSASQMVPTPNLVLLHSPVVKSCLDLPKETEALRKQSRYIYVQGSGDDEDMWSYNLTPTMFWEPDNLHKILSQGIGGEQLKETLELIVEQSKLKPLESGLSEDRRVGDFPIYLGTRPIDYVFSPEERKKYRLIVQADSDKMSDEQSEQEDKKWSILRPGIPSGKRGIHAFRKAIPRVIKAAGEVLPEPVLLCSQEAGLGNDLTGGLAVAILSACYDEARLRVDNVPHLSKEDIKRRLQWIISLLANFSVPSRSHLLRVNEVLLSGPYQDEEHHREEQALLPRMAALSTK